MLDEPEGHGNTVFSPAETFLERQGGVPFCAQCLAYRAGLAQQESRDVMRWLRSPRFVQEERLCERCVRERLVVYAAYPDMS